MVPGLKEYAGLSGATAISNLSQAVKAGPTKLTGEQTKIPEPVLPQVLADNIHSPPVAAAASKGDNSYAQKPIKGSILSSTASSTQPSKDTSTDGTACEQISTDDLCVTFGKIT